MKKEIFFAGGCFWGVEKYFSLITGVLDTEVGYINGNTEYPSYEDVCYMDTGHAEAVRVVYDPGKVSLEFLLDLYFEIIDPTSYNRQGNDVGVQYRTGVYYIDKADRDIIAEALKQLEARYDNPIVVEVAPLEHFYLAEEYHQGYLDKNPGGYCHISPQKFVLAQSSIPHGL